MTTDNENDSNTLAVGFIGGGYMFEAILKQLIAVGDVVDLRKSFVAEPNAERRDVLRAIFGRELTILETPSELFKHCDKLDAFVLAIKPQHLSVALESHPSVVANVNKHPLVVSIMAGVPISRICELLPSGCRVARVMPNLPAVVGEGATGFCLSPNCDASLDGGLVQQIFSCVGPTVERVAENHMDIVTAVSGSGPAYLCLLIEALADGAVQHGLPRDVALRLAAQTCVGAGRLVLNGGEGGGLLHPAVAKDRICSPGGTTIAAVAALEKGGLRSSVIGAVAAAVQRGTDLSKL